MSFPPLPQIATLGEMLKYLRRRAQLTQRELSIAVGYSESQISRLEKNERLADAPTLLARFVPALRLEKEPELVTRLLELAKAPLSEAVRSDVVRSEPLVAIATGQQTHSVAEPVDTPPVHNLPHRLTTFVGRSDEIATLQQRLTGARLVTLTGAGGIGKTSLALEIGRKARFRDGVWLVELAAIHEAALVTKTMAALFALPELPERTPLEALITFLRHKQLLLLLDNCEHLIATCAEAVERLLRFCPDLHILATSREALGVDGEVEWAVTALHRPEGPTSGHSQIKASDIQGYEAVTLFLQRGQSIKADFDLNDQNAPAIAEICTQLDGMPLALELAAARLKGLTVEEVAARLHDRFALLSGGRRTALLRHQTLRAAIDWSYDLLTEPEKCLFRQLALFAGGWSLDAAEAMAAETQAHAQALTLLLQLVSKSLVVADQRAGETRYRMLETIRQYAAEKFRESGEEEAARRRHFAYFLALAQVAEVHLRGVEQIVWAERLEEEHDNLRAALAWAHEQAAGDGSSTDGADAELRLAGALFWFWDLRDHFSEGRRWLASALAQTGGSEATAARATALYAAGALAINQGDFVMARASLEESVKLWRALGDRRGLALSLSVSSSLGWITAKEGRMAAAQALLEEGVALWRALGEKWGLAWALWCLSAVVRHDDLAAARLIAEESVALFRSQGDRIGLVFPLWQLGVIARIEGDFGRSRALYEESLALSRELGAKTMTFMTLQSLGEIAQDQGEYKSALALYQESVAQALLLEHKEDIAHCLIGIGGVAGAGGQAARAARLLSAAATILDQIGLSVAAWPAVPADYERYVAVAHAQLDEATWVALWAEGAALSLDQAVAEALSL